ncbi:MULTISPECIES: tautomerase family protein [unclassified Frankia]|uniref:tautomerase family protein n=1 Tax=unclassified Frankia TaxID=2632575 RepID=UPI0020240212
MPVVTVQIPAGSLDPVQKSELIARITDAVVEVEKAEAIRPYVYVIVDETSRDGYGLAGTPVDVTLAKAAQR